MKKIPFLILILSILLSACSNSNPSSVIPEGEEASSAETIVATQAHTATPTASIPAATPTIHPYLQVEPSQLKNIRLSFWHPWSGEIAQALDTIVNEFNQSNLWGIQVHTLALGGNTTMIDRFEQGLDGGTLPNVVFAPSELILLWQDQHQTFSTLDAYIQDAQWGLTAQERADIPLLYWQQDSFASEQIGVPALRDLHVLIYNQSWAKELGFFTSPQSLESFGQQVCAAAAKRKDIDQTGGWIIDTDPLTTLSWMLTNNPPSLFDAETNRYRFNNPQALEVLSALRTWLDDGCAWNSRLPDPYEYFANRQTLSYSGSLSDILLQSQEMKRAQSPDDWGILPFPVEDGKPVVLIGGSSYAVQQTTPAEQLASWIFVRWLILPRHQVKLTEASGFLPVSASAFDSLQDFRKTYPQWDAAVGLIPLATPAPQSGSWGIAQTILEDAAWQTYQTFTKPEDISTILRELDALIPEVLSINGLQ